jgi:hypothetical protein
MDAKLIMLFLLISTIIVLSQFGTAGGGETRRTSAKSAQKRYRAVTKTR